MSNPVGFAPRLGPLQGLGNCGENIPGGPPNWIGGAGIDADGNLITETTVVGGTFFVPPTAAEPIEAYPGGGPVVPCSDAAAQARGILTHTIYDYVELPTPATGMFIPTGTGTSDVVATAAAGAACEFVSASINVFVGLEGGLIKCTTTPADASVESFTVSMGGVVLDLLGPGGGLPFPQAIYTPPDWEGHGTNGTWWLLRPTALTWPGQDPDNQWNRAMWHPSEIGTLTWHIAAWVYSWEVGFSAAVYGYKRETNYPTPCPIIGPLVSVIDAGSAPPGIVYRDRLMVR